MLKLMQGDCLELMQTIPDKSIDMILCDLPYGTTACKWDTVIPFEPLWEQYERAIKDNGAIVLTAIQPFTSALVMSKPDLFSHSWVWKKTKATNYVQARKKPMKYHEDIVVFAKKQHTYNPQMRKGFSPYKKAQRENYDKDGAVFKDTREPGSVSVSNGERFPSTVIEFSNPNNKSIHPTQKPVELFEYLIKTYTNEGETVLDNCMGSGTTGVACVNTNRNFIGIELDPDYFKIAEKRIADAQNKTEQISLIANK